MWWILQTIVFSIFFIGIIHYLYLFFMNNLTTPIVKDLIHSPSNKYENMFNIINSSNLDNNNNTNTKSNLIKNNTSINDLKYDLSDLIPNNSSQLHTNVQQNMKDELKSFLHDQLNN